MKRETWTRSRRASRRVASGLLVLSTLVAGAIAQTQVIAGRVLRRDGSVAAGWQVRGVGRTIPESTRLGRVVRTEATSDAGGNFVLKVERGVGLDLWAFGRDGRTTAVAFDCGPGRPVELRALPDAARGATTRACRLTLAIPTGWRSFGPFTVGVAAPLSAWAERRVKAAADGSFLLPRSPGAHRTVIVYDRFDQPVYGIEQSVPTDGKAFTIELPAPVRLPVRVADGRGIPVGEARVDVQLFWFAQYPASNSRFGRPPYRSLERGALTDADGRAEIVCPMVPGQRFVTVVGAGYEALVGPSSDLGIVPETVEDGLPTFGRQSFVLGDRAKGWTPGADYGGLRLEFLLDHLPGRNSRVGLGLARVPPLGGLSPPTRKLFTQARVELATGFDQLVGPAGGRPVRVRIAVQTPDGVPWSGRRVEVVSTKPFLRTQSTMLDASGRGELTLAEGSYRLIGLGDRHRLSWPLSTAKAGAEQTIAAKARRLDQCELQLPVAAGGLDPSQVRVRPLRIRTPSGRRLSGEVQLWRDRAQHLIHALRSGADGKLVVRWFNHPDLIFGMQVVGGGLDYRFTLKPTEPGEPIEVPR